MIRFGTSGWRAVIGDEFTFHNVRLVTSAIADLLRDDPRLEPRILVGYDTRFLSERAAREVASVLSTRGVEALLCVRDAPTPAVSLQVRTRPAAGAIYITASHNPPEYNGLKYYDAHGAPASQQDTQRIELEIVRLETHGFDEQVARDDRRIVEIDPQAAYLTHLAKSLDIERIRAAGLKFAVDAMYGTSREYLDRVLIESECTVQVIHNFTDPYFGGYSPECSEANLSELKELVTTTGADLGLATDGDGDRFGIVDANGSFVPTDDVLALLFDYLASERGVGGRFVRTVATSHLLDRVARKYGIEVDETAVGFKHIGHRMVDQSARVGGEQSAGFSLATHLPEKDGILACLLVAELVAVRGRPLHVLRDELFAEHGTLHHRLRSLPLTFDHDAALERLIRTPPTQLGSRQVTSVNRIDGIRLTLDDGGWCLVRRSGTEPLLRIYAEADTVEAVEAAILAAETLVSETES